MKQLQAANPRRLIIALIVLMVLSGVLFYFMRDIVREVVVYPLSYLIYLIRILLDVTPQMFCWGSVLLISAWIAFRSLNPKRKIEQLPPRIVPESEAGGTGTGRVTTWAVKVNILEQYHGGYFMSSFHFSMGRLLMELLAHRYRLTPGEVEERVRAGTIDLPEDVEEYLRYSLSRPEMSGSPMRRLWQRFIFSLYRRFHWSFLEEKDASPGNQAMRRLDKVILYMEEELEVSHEHPGQSSR